MPKPIFVLGKHRSGTTWLANQLCQHPLIAGITHEGHEGIHESAYFSFIYNRYGDLTNKSNFVEFVEVISASDYFRLAGAAKEYLYSLWPTTYEDVFQTVMDDYALSQDAVYWVEKSPSHSLLVKQLAAIYSEARFISIIRDAKDVVVSSTVKDSTPNLNFYIRQQMIFRIVLSWTYYNKSLNAFASHSERILTLQYKEMRADLTRSMQKVCAFLDLSFDRRMCDQAFIPNSSFRQETNRRQALSTSEVKLVRLWQRLLRPIPLWMMTALYRATAMKKRRSLPAWFFSMYPLQESTRQLDAIESHKKTTTMDKAVDISLPQN